MSDRILDPQTTARLTQIVTEFESELQKLPSHSEQSRKLSEDITRLKNHLTSSDVAAEHLHESLHTMRTSAQELVDSVEGKVLQDSPYLAELGRILGMV